jgi:putative sigma-54 modulation protein
MQVNISGHQLDVTEPMRDYVGEKLAKLERHVGKITNVQVIMEVEKLKQKIEATLHVAGAKDIVANAEHDDMYAAIDLLTDKLDRQLLKHKEKQLSQLQGAAAR